MPAWTLEKAVVFCSLGGLDAVLEFVTDLSFSAPLVCENIHPFLAPFTFLRQWQTLRHCQQATLTMHAHHTYHRSTYPFRRCFHAVMQSDATVKSVTDEVRFATYDD